MANGVLSLATFFFLFLTMLISLTFSSTHVVVDGDVLLLPPFFPRQYAPVVRCRVGVVQSVVCENVPTILIGPMGQHGPIRCHKLTAEGWIWSRTVGIVAV